jgi:hypothetical protein
VGVPEVGVPDVRVPEATEELGVHPASCKRTIEATAICRTNLTGPDDITGFRGRRFVSDVITAEPATQTSDRDEDTFQ